MPYPKPSKIIFATGNKEKVKDFQILFDKFDITLVQPDKKIEVVEDADNLLDNARKKALAYAHIYPDEIVMGNDGGVKIPYLGDDWNHVLTKRLSGKDMDGRFTERQRAETLLELMKGAKGEERKVLWYEAIVLVKNNQTVLELHVCGGEGILLDYIPDEFDDEGGYWTGYLWFLPEHGKTYMQLTEEEKLASSEVKRRLGEELKKL